MRAADGAQPGHYLKIDAPEVIGLHFARGAHLRRSHERPRKHDAVLAAYVMEMAYVLRHLQ
jgi:hypothetical protein